MTLQRARISLSVTSSSWRHTLAVALLALIMAVAPCAAEICNTTCALAHDHGAHAQPTAPIAASTSAASAASASAASAPATTESAARTTAAATHCVKHVAAADAHGMRGTSGTSAASSIIASVHACQTHTHPLQTAASLAATTDARLSASSLSSAMLPSVTVAPQAPPPLASTLIERPSTQPLRSRPLTLALRI